MILAHWQQFELVCKLANAPPPARAIYDVIAVWLRTYFGQGNILERVGSNLQRQYDNSIKYPHARNEALEKFYQEFVNVEGAIVLFKMNPSALPAPAVTASSRPEEGLNSSPKRVKVSFLTIIN